MKKTNLWLPKGNEVGAIKQGDEINIHTTLYKIDKQEGPAVQHGSSTQYLVITYEGKRSEKEQCTYIYKIQYILHV